MYQISRRNDSSSSLVVVAVNQFSSQPLWLGRQMDCLNTASCMLYRESSDRPGMSCSLYSLGICFLDVTRINSMNLLKYILYIRWWMCFIFNICGIQTMKMFWNFHSSYLINRSGWVHLKYSGLQMQRSHQRMPIPTQRSLTFPCLQPKDTRSVSRYLLHIQHSLSTSAHLKVLTGTNWEHQKETLLMTYKASMWTILHLSGASVLAAPT